MIRFGDDDAGFRIMRAAGGAVYNRAGETVISEHTRDRLRGGVVFSCYTGRDGSIELHCSSFSPNWLTRNLLWFVFDYVFNPSQLGCRKAFVRVRESNTKSLRFVKHLGFVEEARIEDTYPDDATIILGLHRDKCFWYDTAQKLLEYQRTAHG